MVTSTLLALAGMVGLWWLYFYGWRGYRLDRTRQDLFALRDDLMAYWQRAGLPFEAPAYRLMREMLNGAIRFSHRVSLLRLAALMVVDAQFKGVDGAAFERRFEAALEGLSPDVQAHLRAVRRQAHLILLQHVVFGSLLLSVAYWLVRVSRMTQRVTGRLLREKRWSSLDDAVLRT